MYKLIRKVLFFFDPEVIHGWVMNRLDLAYKIPISRYLLENRYFFDEPSLHQDLWGIHFPNPVGLAAGFDKNAQHIDSLSTLGFGFIEIGTLTPRSQPGNPKPRMFRLPADSGLINRMGFNNKGVHSAVIKLKKRKEAMIVGGNIGKNKEVPNEIAHKDFEECFEALHKYVDYFVVNVSSPNTPGLRALQDKEPLTKLLSGLQQMNRDLGANKPILLKIAPDLTDGQLDDIIDIVRETRLSGIVATNTTLSRANLNTSDNTVKKIGDGGLSGKPLKERSTEVIRYIHKNSNGSIPIIAVGGIFTAEDAIEKIEAGARLVQVYTGFIYEGPGIVKRICKGLVKRGIRFDNLPKN